VVLRRYGLGDPVVRMIHGRPSLRGRSPRDPSPRGPASRTAFHACAFDKQHNSVLFRCVGLHGEFEF
jgi:hypothetical protein